VLDKGQEDDWFASTFITSLTIAAAVALTAFVVWELRRPDPIVDLRLLGMRNFGVGNLLMFMLGFVLLGSTALLPLFVQTVLGYTATDAGLVLSPGGFAIMALMPVVGALVGRVDPRWLIAFGLALTSFGLYDMTRFFLEIDYATIAWARAYQSMGLAFLFIPINTIAYLGITPEKSNNASAIINMMRNLGGSFGIALATTLLARRQQYHQNMLVEHVTPWSNAYDATIAAMRSVFAAAGANAADATQQAQAFVYQMVQRQATVLSFIDTFWLLAVLFAALMPFVVLMRRPRGGAAPPAH
jgi:MFS transporter, DHA2 family, multidrug resistance protein